MKRFLALATAALTWAASHAADIPLSAFDGTWVIRNAEMNGDALPSDATSSVELEIKGGKYTFRSNDTTALGKFQLDTSHTPAWMTLHEDEGPNAGRDIDAIVELIPGGWRACYAFQAGGRPKEFKAPADTGHFLASFHRKPGTEPKSKPIRALLISGGCCHDYPGQDKILSEGIGARANVEWTIVRDPGETGTKHKISVYGKENWADGYDIVVHNECFADEKELEWLERVVKPHRDGGRSEEHTSELQSLAFSYAVFCLKKKNLIILMIH